MIAKEAGALLRMRRQRREALAEGKITLCP